MESLMELLGKFAVPIVVIGLALAILLVIRMVAKNYRKVAPNVVLVVSGRGVKDPATGKRVGYRVVQGGATFVMPMFEEAEEMQLGLMQVAVQIKNAPNKDGVMVSVDAIANVKISNKTADLMAAVERFLSKQPEEIQEIIRGVLEGTLRQMIGTLTIEQIVQDRETLAKKIVEIMGEELVRIGVVCDNFVISDVTDAQGYIVAMGAKRVADVKRDATIAQAEAEREAKIKSSDAKRQADENSLNNQAVVAAAQRDLELKQAGFLQETATAKASAELAGDIAKATAQQKLVVEEARVRTVEAEQNTLVAEKEALRVEKELIATTVKPAEAKREADKITADGERQAIVIRAEGAKRKLVIDAEAAADALAVSTKAQSEAAVVKANAEADATKAKAIANQASLTAEGEGRAAAEAAVKRQNGLAEAEIKKANLLAAADGAKAQGEAEGAALRAKGEGEAAGIAAKNQALADMSENAKMMLVIERLPNLIEKSGEAMRAASEPMAHAIGAGLAAIDKVSIVDLGGNKDGKGGNALGTFAGIPAELMKAGTVFTALEQAIPGWAQKYLGLGVDPTKVAAPAATTSEPPAQA